MGNMYSIEATAKTRKEAIQRALDELNVEMHEVEKIDIIDEGSRGIFGIGARDVRVRVTVDKAPPRKPRADKPHGDKPRTDKPRAGAREERPARQSKPERHEKRQQPPRQEDAAAKTAETAASTGEGDEKEQQQQRRRRNRTVRRPGRGAARNRDNGGKPAETTATPQGERREPARRAPEPRPASAERADERTREEEVEITPLTDEQGREAAAMLLAIIEKMGIEATVAYERGEDGTARLNVDSPDSALLIGRKGRNLQSMQYLINRVMSRSDESDLTERLIVDIEGYVARRKAALEEMAGEMAQRAKATGREMRLKPLSPQERRIIHLALQDDPDVRTFSMGESLYRTVIISPKNRRGGGERRPSGRGEGNRSGRGRRGGRGGRPRRENREPAASAHSGESNGGERTNA
jgi:spoIIIJ-associated protein